MFEGISAEFIGGGLLALLLYLIGSVNPVARRCLYALWRRSRPGLVARYAAARKAPTWRKGFAALALLSLVGGAATGVLMGGMNGAAPPWALSWLGITVAGILLVASVEECWPTGR